MLADARKHVNTDTNDTHTRIYTSKHTILKREEGGLLKIKRMLRAFTFSRKTVLVKNSHKNIENANKNQKQKESRREVAWKWDKWTIGTVKTKQNESKSKKGKGTKKLEQMEQCWYLGALEGGRTVNLVGGVRGSTHVPHTHTTIQYRTSLLRTRKG